MRTNETSKVPASIQTRTHDLFDSMRLELGRVFDKFEFGRGSLPSGLSRQGAGLIAPELDVHENDTSFAIEAEVPGVDEKDITVTYAGGVLTVKGEKKIEHEEKTENYYLSERSFGTFERAIRLPDGIDESNISAHMQKGVLRIVAPKMPGKAVAQRRIEIKKT